MTGKWRQSLMVGLTAAVFLGAAGAYAISLGSLSSPSRADLPVIALSGSIDPVPVAANAAQPPVTEEAPTAESASTEPVEKKPTVTSPKPAETAVNKDTSREVIAPDVREEDSGGDDDEAADEVEEQGDDDSSQGESSSRDEQELDD